jgi:hypothetical protein
MSKIFSHPDVTEFKNRVKTRLYIKGRFKKSCFEPKIGKKLSF